MILRKPVAKFLVSSVACTARHASTSSERMACHYRVAWSINPHMRVGASNFARAHGQHRAFVAQLRSAGAEVEMLPFVHGAYDSVFAKDTAILDERNGARRALLADPLHPERQSEQTDRAARLREIGFDVVPSPVPLEGGDLVRVPSAPHAFLGHGFRSSRAAAPHLERFLDAEVTPLRLVDPDFYHLDVALAVLDDRTALVCESALAPESLRALRDHASIDRVVPIPRDETMAFGLNFVQVGATVVVGSRAPTVERVLASRGLSVVHTPLREFQLAGGSAACLVARVGQTNLLPDSVHSIKRTAA